jgi:hypothetical protein
MIPIDITEDELWDLIDKWRTIATSGTRGPYLSSKPETAYGQGLTQCAEELADALLAAEDRSDVQPGRRAT